MTRDTQPSASAERMRRSSRARQRKGLHCITLPIRDAEIEALVRRGFLAVPHDRHAVAAALATWLDRTLQAPGRDPLRAWARD